MANLVADCPRCGSKNMTFEMPHYHAVGTSRNVNGYTRYHFELFSICTHCLKSTTFYAISKLDDASRSYFNSHYILSKSAVTLNNLLEINTFISIKDFAKISPPEYLPKEIEEVFKEGATCFSVACYNAAGAMFRLCLDLATKHQLDNAKPDKVPPRAKNYLKDRLDFLFQERILPEHLARLATCIKDNGNDGAHDGNLTKEDAEDILDFTERLLDRLYSEPERISLAEARREKRRAN